MTLKRISGPEREKSEMLRISNDSERENNEFKATAEAGTQMNNNDVYERHGVCA